MSTETYTWPDLAISLYDRLTGRGAEIQYDFQQFDLLVPASTAPDAPHARWTVNGSLTIRTKDQASA